MILGIWKIHCFIILKRFLIYNISGNYEEQNKERASKVLQCYFICDKYNVKDRLDLRFKRQGETNMWIQPTFEDVRFGFEVTLYIMNR